MKRHPVDPIRALLLVQRLLSGKVDKAGVELYLHSWRVGGALEHHSEDVQTAAYLHDIVEDAGWSLDDLRAEGFSERTLALVDLLTRRPGEIYADYIERVATDTDATLIKLADLGDNLDVTRLPELLPEHLSLLQRYHRAHKRLTEVFEALG